MRAMILCLSPGECAKLLNGDLSVLARKKFPKDYVGWVYIYCTKGGKYLFKDIYAEKNGEGKLYYVDDKEHDSWSQQLNGKVVARFWCNKVEEIKWELPNKLIFPKNMLANACLSGEELYKYLGEKGGYAIHIDDLKIFDEPKEINEFDKIVCGFGDGLVATNRLTRAPQNGWCYVYVEK